MAFHYEIVRNDDTLTLRLGGRLTLGPQLLAFGRQVSELLATGPRGVLLDMAAVDEVDSAGLGELVLLYAAASQHRCPLCLVRLTPRIERMLETTKLDGILPHFDGPLAARSWIAKAT